MVIRSTFRLLRCLDCSSAWILISTTQHTAAVQHNTGWHNLHGCLCVLSQCGVLWVFACRSLGAGQAGAEAEVHRSDRGLLCQVWRQDSGAGTLCADCAHVCTLCGRHWQHVIQQVSVAVAFASGCLSAQLNKAHQLPQSGSSMCTVHPLLLQGRDVSTCTCRVCYQCSCWSGRIGLTSTYSQRSHGWPVHVGPPAGRQNAAHCA